MSKMFSTRNVTLGESEAFGQVPVSRYYDVKLNSARVEILG